MFRLARTRYEEQNGMRKRKREKHKSQNKVHLPPVRLEVLHTVQGKIKRTYTTRIEATTADTTYALFASCVLFSGVAFLSAMTTIRPNQPTSHTETLPKSPSAPPVSFHALRRTGVHISARTFSNVMIPVPRWCNSEGKGKTRGYKASQEI
jgi:hypothetical protein